MCRHEVGRNLSGIMMLILAGLTAMTTTANGQPKPLYDGTAACGNGACDRNESASRYPQDRHGDYRKVLLDPADAVFDPPTLNVPPGTSSASLDLTVSSTTLEGVDGADIIIGSDLPVILFEYSQEWLDNFGVFPPFYQTGIYDNDVFVGGFRATLGPTTLNVGILTIDISSAKPDQCYGVWVDYDRDFNISALYAPGVNDPLFGAAELCVSICDTSECVVDADCDDGDPCTIDTCVNGCCTTEPLEPCTVDFEYACVILPTPSDTDVSDTLPATLPQVALSEMFYVEFWAMDSRDANTGLVSVYTDLDYPEDMASCVRPITTDLFDLFQSGDCAGTIVEELGGSQLDADVGTEPEWARVAYVEFTADALGTAEFSLLPADLESSAYRRGEIPPSGIVYGSCITEVGCRCIYDLDNNCAVAAGDLGLFAGCWECCDTDLCWEENVCRHKDFDCNGCVSGGDLGWFAGAWLKDCDELDPMAGYPPCRECDGSILCPWPATPSLGTQQGASPVTGRGEDAHVRLSWRLTQQPVEASTLEVLPRSAVGVISAGEHVFAEVWVRDDSPSSGGLTAVFADVLFDPLLFEVVSINTSDTFVLFAEPELRGGEGMIRRTGGATMEPDHGVNKWMRVSVVELRALVDVAKPKVTVRPSPDESISRRGHGLVPSDQIKIIPNESWRNDRPRTIGPTRGIADDARNDN